MLEKQAENTRCLRARVSPIVSYFLSSLFPLYLLFGLFLVDYVVETNAFLSPLSTHWFPRLALLENVG